MLNNHHSTPFFLLLCLLLAMPLVGNADVSPETLAKRAKRKNMTLKEWNTDAASRTKWLDHMTVYDAEGQVSREVEYDGKNRPVRIRKYEYNDNGTKRKQYNYLPNGKLYSVKVFEYTFSEIDPIDRHIEPHEPHQLERDGGRETDEPTRHEIRDLDGACSSGVAVGCQSVFRAGDRGRTHCGL